MGRKLKIFLDTIATILVIVVILYIFGNAFFPKQTSKIVGFNFYTLLTDSMNPVIPPGSLVLSKTVKEQTQLRPGDIVTFDGDRFGEKYTFTHYLKKIEADETGQQRYYTQGNTADEFDPFITYKNNIKGLYIFHVPYLGNAIRFLRSPFGLIEILIVCLLLLNQHFVGGFFDEQDRLVLQIEQGKRKKLQLRKVKYQMNKGELFLKGKLYNPSKDDSVSSSRMLIELLGKKNEVVDSQIRVLANIGPQEWVHWECVSEYGKKTEDYRVTLMPKEENEKEECLPEV